MEQKQIKDKANQKEKRRRIEFLVLFSLFIGVIVWRFFYPDLLEKGYGIPRYLINSITFYITAHIVISFSRLLLVGIYLRRHHQQMEFKDNFIIGINQIASILYFVALVFGAFFLFDIDPKDFFTSISIFAAAIAILFKDYINNMINGLIIMFSSHLSIDDYIGIGDYKGRIIDITLINLHLLTEDDDVIYIANSAILTGNVTNYTIRNQRKIILEFALKPEQITGLDELENHLVLSLQPWSTQILPESPQLRVVNINTSTVIIKFQMVLQRASRRVERDIRRHLNWQIITYINEEKRTENVGS